MFLDKKLKNYVTAIAEQGLLRKRTLRSDDQNLVYFDSNDYLSLSQDPKLAAAYQKAYGLYPVGSGSSMLLSGYHTAHQTVERAFASFLNTDECLLFSSGYAANLALTALLGRLKTHCFIDKELHASLYDGLALSQVPFTRYFHNDLADLSQKLTTNTQDSALITEGIFSMSGQIAPLADIWPLCMKHQTELFVDEAHSFGVLGEQGRGAISLHGLSQKEVPLRVIPLGKAFAAQGALIAGQSEWIKALLQAGRSFIYSTAISPALSYGFLTALDAVAAADERRTTLQNLIGLFRELSKNSPLNWADSLTPIQQLRLGCPHLAMHYSTELKKRGMSCFPVRTPTVRKKDTGLRIILNYHHSPEQIRLLFHHLSDIHEHQPQ